MTEKNLLYPANPTNISPKITQTSAAFKKEVSGVMGSILLFFIVYLLMFILAVALVAGCVFAGIALIINLPRIITIFIGIGLIVFGVMIFIFLVKFLFAVSRYDRSGIIEVTEKDQPVLFEFIRRLSKDTQAPFPKKIYLSPDVNACVFYDSSFWSMFFPIRKNLQIGLGLVNSVNVSEFKAVIAHEFGHFSQRSMKLGSFVYNVNRIIHNMLYDNKGYSGFLGSWASVDGIFAFFANLTIRFAQAIQWVLIRMYGFINKNYMRLSREMEFHADAVAASVSGSKSLVTALRRVELADAGYNMTLNTCNDFYRQKKIASNIYQGQRLVLEQYAEEFKLPVQNGLPVVNKEFIENNNLSRVNFKDQWASHPSVEDREEHLNSLAVDAEIVTEPAWALFSDAEQLQSRLTQKIYEHIKDAPELTAIGNGEFEEKLKTDKKRFSFPEEYNGFYNDRQIALLDIRQLSLADKGGISVFEEIFSSANALLYKHIRAMEGDVATLKAIAENNISTKSFDFDGTKYDRKDAGMIAETVNKEKAELQQQLDELDKKAIRFFFDKALQHGEGEALKKMYEEYFEHRTKAEEFLKDINTTLESLGPIYGGQSIPIEQINSMISDLKNQYEIRLKGWLKRWMAVGAFDSSAVEKTQMEKFIDSNYVYFSGTSFFETELQEMNAVCHDSWAAVNTFLFEKFKAILVLQLKYRN